jgi:hypothetical protein
MTDFRSWEAKNLARFAKEASLEILQLQDDLKIAINAYRYFMKPLHAPAIRVILLHSPDGMTLAELHKETGVREDTLRNTVESMPDVYIDRWTGPHRGQWAAVYCLHPAPPNCPRPDHA